MRNIVFDLGGVVIDWNPRKVTEEYPGDPGLPNYLFHKGFFQEYWTEFDRGAVTEGELTVQMADVTGFAVNECRHFIEYIKHSLVDIPETVELVKELSAKSYKLYCLSNISEEFYDYLKVRDVFNYFDGRIISGIEKLIKPDEGIYRLLLERYGLKPEETLFIDDLEKNTEAAAKLGIHTVCFADREKGYQEIAEKLRLSCRKPERVAVR